MDDQKTLEFVEDFEREVERAMAFLFLESAQTDRAAQKSKVGSVDQVMDERE